MQEEAMTKDAKLRELIVYIATKSETDERFGATKLNKILYYSDFYAYRRLGKPITEAEYQHLQQGPAPRGLLEAQRSLIDDGSALFLTRTRFNFTQHRIAPRREPDLSLFSGSEIDIVDSVIQSLWAMTGKQASDMSHEEIGWRVTDEFETIPYRTAWLSAQPLTDEQIEQGKEIAKRHALCE